MAKGMYYYLRQAWKHPDEKVLRDRMTEWRKTDAVVEVEKPLRLDRARALGYKAKKGFFVVRARLVRGGRKKHRINRNRRSKRQTVRLTLQMNYRGVAEQRVARKYPNLEVLNSYLIGKDGIHYFFEVILVDPERPEIKNDKNLSWISKDANLKRVFRGLTSAGKKSRGLRYKGPGLKVRPSARARGHKGK